jgi:uncharacterized membrane-anchored protein
MKYWILAVVVLLQLGVVGRMIFHREDVLIHGREVKFVTRPVDPVDPFAGRYVALRFEAETFDTSEGIV